MYTKGDLVLVTDGNIVYTCIVLSHKYNATSVRQYSFYYTYCLETGEYGMVYDDEIMSLVSKNFAPNFECESSMFNTDYSFYDYLYEAFSYWPYMAASGSFP